MSYTFFLLYLLPVAIMTRSPSIPFCTYLCGNDTCQFRFAVFGLNASLNLATFIRGEAWHWPHQLPPPLSTSIFSPKQTPKTKHPAAQRHTAPEAVVASSLVITATFAPLAQSEKFWEGFWVRQHVEERRGWRCEHGRTAGRRRRHGWTTGRIRHQVRACVRHSILVPCVYGQWFRRCFFVQYSVLSVFSRLN